MKQITLPGLKKVVRAWVCGPGYGHMELKKNVAILELRYQTEQQFKKSLPNWA